MRDMQNIFYVNGKKMSYLYIRFSWFSSVFSAILTGFILLVFMEATLLAQQVSGNPLPRFVSLGSDKVNVRRGAGQSHEISWVFIQDGLPVEIIHEFDNWRKIRDFEGKEGWILKSLLSSKRSALIGPWDPSILVDLYSRPDITTPLQAKLKSLVLVYIQECNGEWCLVSGNYKPDKLSASESSFKGWLKQDQLWGVYNDEKLD